MEEWGGANGFGYLGQTQEQLNTPKSTTNEGGLHFIVSPIKRLKDDFG